jgi:uncharacterized membrane protein
MVTIQTNRMLGGIGAIFSVFGIVSTISSVLSYGYSNSTTANLPLLLITGSVGLFAFVGFILFLVAMYGFSRDYNEHKIFNYLLYGFVTTLVAAVIGTVIVMIAFLFNLASILPSLSPETTVPSQVSSSLVSSIAPFLEIFSVVGVIWIAFNVKALNLLRERSGVPLFRTAAFVLLAGAVVNVVIGTIFATLVYFGSIDYATFLLSAIPGGLTQYIAWAILAIAFFRIKSPPPPRMFLPNITINARQMKYCPNCGTPNQSNAAYCAQCGQKL